MTGSPLIAVTSRSFSSNPALCDLLAVHFPVHRLNTDGVRLAGVELVDFLRGAKGAIVGVEALNAQVLDDLPDLRVISKYGVGLDQIDLRALQVRGIRLAVSPGVNAGAVAEMAVLLMLSVYRRMHEAFAAVEHGQWPGLTGQQLSGKTVGVVGVGHVGTQLIELLRGFGCQIVACDPALGDSETISHTELEELLSRADVVSLHVPLTEQTRGFIGARELALMKPGSVIINTSRGGLIDERALAEALVSHLGGAGLDVLSGEPTINQQLAGLPNVVVTPHMSGSTQESNLAMGMAAIEGLREWYDELSC